MLQCNKVVPGVTIRNKIKPSVDAFKVNGVSREDACFGSWDCNSSGSSLVNPDALDDEVSVSWICWFSLGAHR